MFRLFSFDPSGSATTGMVGAGPRSMTVPQPAVAARSTSRPAVWGAIGAYAVMALIVLYPVLAVHVPALGDYLNHLARMHVVADIGRSEALRGFYQVQWQAVPYLAMDAAFVVLNQVATIYQAGRLYVAISVILPVVSVAVLHFVVHRRFSLVPMTAFLFCYNYLLSWGLLNYLPPLCLAVLLFAGWIGSAGWPRWPRAILFSVLALGLYLSHLAAFGAYGLAVGGFELGRAWRAGFRPWRTIAADWLAAAALAVPAIVLALSVHLERPSVGVALTSYGSLNTKLVALLSPVLFSGSPTDLLAGWFALLVLLAGLGTGRLRLAPSVWPAALAVGAVAVCMPSWFFGIFLMDVRLPLLVVLLVIGATSTTPRMERGVAAAVLGGFLVLTAVRSVGIAAELQAGDAQIAEVRQVVAAMPRGKRLLLMDTATAGRALPYWATLHIGMVAVIDRDAFVPNLFTGQGTVRPAPAMRASSTPYGPPLSVADLMDGLGRTDDPAGDTGDGMGGRVYWLGWQGKFDYVLIEHFGSRPAVPPGVLRLVASSSVADLYRIDQTGTP